MDERVKAQLIEENLSLVQHVVLQVASHFPRHVDRAELARAGALGLVEAAQRFDPERGVPFDKFAARRIRGAILDAVRAVDWAPRSVRAFGRQLEQAEQELAASGTPATLEEVASALELPVAEVHRMRDRVYRSVVLGLDHVPTSDADDEVSLGETLVDRSSPGPDETLETRELLGYLRDAVALLPDRHRVVVVGYFLENRTSAELAEALGVTESRISQVRTEAIEMLRGGIEAQFTPAKPAAPNGRCVRRQAAFAEAIGELRPWRDRLAV